MEERSEWLWKSQKRKIHRRGKYTEGKIEEDRGDGREKTKIQGRLKKIAAMEEREN